MSQTNRALNRILLALAGLMLIAAGAATAGAGIMPDAAAAWAATGSSLVDQTGSLLASAPLPGPARSWWAVAGVAALVLAAGLGIAWLASQGGGRTHRVGRETDGGRGTTVVETGLISAAVTEALAGNRLVLGTSVSAWEVKGEPGLRLRLQARQGASPGRSPTPPTNWSRGSTRCWAIRFRFWSESPVAPEPGWLYPVAPASAARRTYRCTASPRHDRKGNIMGIDDTVNNTVIHHIGAAKEGAGIVTGNQDLQREGQHEQAQAKLQEAGERVKDAAADIGVNIKDAARRLKDGFRKE